MPCRALTSWKRSLSVRRRPAAVAIQPAVVDDLAPERQQHGLDQDRQARADQFLEGLRQGEHAVGEGRLLGSHQDGVLFQLTEEVESACHEMPPETDDFQFLVRQASGILGRKVSMRFGWTRRASLTWGRFSRDRPENLSGVAGWSGSTWRRWFPKNNNVRCSQ